MEHATRGELERAEPLDGAEAQVDDGQQVTRPNGSGVILQEYRPGLTRELDLRESPAGLLDWGGRDLAPEFAQFP